MTMRSTGVVLMLLAAIFVFPAAAKDADKPTVAIIGTGDMGDSLGPRLAGLGYPVIYGTRDPGSEKVTQLLARTGMGAKAASAAEAAGVADVVLLAVPWPAMETVAQGLGDLKGKVVIDISMPSDQGEDGYYVPLLETSSAEMIQAWNPEARVVKAFATQGSFVIDDREAKELVARMAAEMGLDPVDAGPLRMSRDIEALQRLYMVPLLQRRAVAWEPYFRRSYYWECLWQDDMSKPVADADNLANIPETQGPARPCPGP